MTRPAKAGDATERQLAARFAQLRVAERAEAPDFPLEPSVSPATPTARRYHPILTGALAAGVAGFALFFAGQKPVPEPGELYVSIMTASEMTTDRLMLVSAGILPEAAELPATYDIDMSVLPAQGQE